MLVEQYVKLTGRTESIKIDVPYDTDITGEPIREQKIFALRFLHHAMGMVTEAGEVLEAAMHQRDQVNWLEEFGDACWYIARMCEVMEVDMEIPHWTDVDNVFTAQDIGIFMAIEAAQLMDCAKRFYYYGKPLDRERAIQHISGYYKWVIRGCKLFNFDLAEVFARNIGKLEARYPEKFSDFRAENRDLEAERKALQGE